ncbi:hypothetical protein Q669_17170 [Labrenzia sp. C1B10]|nr:hypothetical protein Q669_17170 [Labrenzia sp. C1B10]ERS07022.1 hypothetical protein Q675_22800 [Labrenzia sp. C1B70]
MKSRVFLESPGRQRTGIGDAASSDAGLADGHSQPDKVRPSGLFQVKSTTGGIGAVLELTSASCGAEVMGVSRNVSIQKLFFSKIEWIAGGCQ